MSSARKITLTSSDGDTFEIDEVVALESQTIKHMIKNDCVNDNGVHLLNVTSKILAKIIEYCKKHVEATSSVEKPSDDVLEAWDAEFVKVDEAMLFDLASAANYLNIKSLMDLTCKTIAKMLQSKLPDDIRRTFKIVSDYSPEEEEEVHWENKWAWE